MQHKFKRGDKIRRIKSAFGICLVGKIYTFKEYNKIQTALFIKEDHYSSGYDIAHFELVESAKPIENDIEWLDRVQANFKE
jgi:hypothetical protein